MDILIRGARQLLTLRGQPRARRGLELLELGLIPDGAVLIRDGVIQEAGPSRRVENLNAARGAVEIDATGRIVMPGFVDSHTHLLSGPSWLEEYESRVNGSAGRHFLHVPELQATFRSMQTSSATRLESRARKVVAAMVRHGTTTIEAKTGFGGNDTGELKMLRVLGKLNRRPLDVTATCMAAPWAAAEELRRYMEWWSADLLPKVQRRKLARFADISFDWSEIGMREARQSLEAAGRLGFLLKMHLGLHRPADYVRTAVELGAVSVDHIENASDAEIAVLAQSEAVATLLPGTAHYTGSGGRPARDLISRGAAVALASDFNPHTSPTCNMQMVISLACGQLRMKPAEAIAASTINGAHAIRLGDRLGSLETGKDADLIILNASDYREIPYFFGCNQVHLTMKRGVVIYREGVVERNGGEK